MDGKVSIAAASVHKHPTLSSGNAWSGDFVFSYTNSGLWLSSGTATLAVDYNMSKMQFSSANGSIEFHPSIAIPVDANSSTTYQLDIGSTYIISVTGNPWHGVYIVQTGHSGSNYHISPLTEIFGWEIEMETAPVVIRISCLNPDYGFWAYAFKI